MINYTQSYYSEDFGKKLVKKRIRWSANGVGFFISFYIFTSVLMQSIVMEIIRNLGGSVYETYSLLSSDFIYYLEIFIAVSSVLVPGLVYVLFSKQRLSSLVPIKAVKPSSFVPVVFIGLAVAMVANFAVNIVIENLSLIGITDKSESVMQNNSNLLLDIISIAVVPAIVEEFALRGIFMGTMRRFGDPIAIITSSVVFSLLHLNLTQIPFAFILGLILGYAVCKTNSLIPSMTIHFINNFYAIVSAHLFSDTSSYDLLSVVIFMSVTLLIMVAGIISLVYMSNRKKDFFRFDRCSESILSVREQILPSFINPGIIISISICIYLTILNSGFSI